jgi:branched-chain amino acid transport system ATP-binding protein
VSGPPAPVLRCDGLRKSFGGLAAVRDLEFEVAEGEIYGVAGPNGAGKTTLFNLITGHTRPDAGVVAFRGRDLAGTGAHERFVSGIARTFQTPAAFDSESVLANVAIAAHFGRRRRRGLRLRGFSAEELDVAEAALERVGLGELAAQPAGTLRVFDKKRLMVASAIVSEPAILLLDEPFGGLSDADIDVFLELVTDINRDLGISVLIIEHVLRALFALSDRLLVMHHGAQIFEGDPREAIKDPLVVESYLGASAVTSLEAAG